MAETAETVGATKAAVKTVKTVKTESAEPVASEAAGAAGTSRKTVLAVDDDYRVRHLLVMTLEGAFAVLTADDGESCLATIREHRPDLVLLDIDMPVLDGLSVCRLLKANPVTRDIPVLIVSARCSEEDVRRAREAGADDYVLKPFSPIELLKRVRLRLDGPA
ncbi:MAG: response regulator [Chloroflexi bacterium]|nr:response regulator [Chloroflexota bacterium]